MEWSQNGGVFKTHHTNNGNDRVAYNSLIVAQWQKNKELSNWQCN